MDLPVMPETVRALRARLDRERYPARVTVPRETAEALEAWLLAVREARVAEWRAAGTPKDWYCDLGPLVVGPSFGVMFKGVEVCAEGAVG